MSIYTTDEVHAMAWVAYQMGFDHASIFKAIMSRDMIDDYVDGYLAAVERARSSCPARDNRMPHAFEWNSYNQVVQCGACGRIAEKEPTQ